LSARPARARCGCGWTELEPHAAAFERAAQKLIARAKRHNDLIGRPVHLDGTAFITYAKAFHDCPDAAACAASRSTPEAAP
jgi:hypothetical protein